MKLPVEYFPKVRRVLQVVGEMPQPLTDFRERIIQAIGGRRVNQVPQIFVHECPTFLLDVRTCVSERDFGRFTVLRRACFLDAAHVRELLEELRVTGCTNGCTSLSQSTPKARRGAKVHPERNFLLKSDFHESAHSGPEKGSRLIIRWSLVRVQAGPLRRPPLNGGFRRARLRAGFGCAFIPTLANGSATPRSCRWGPT